MSARSIGLLVCSSLLLAPLLCSCSDDPAASSDDAGVTPVNDDTTDDDDDTADADDDATDDDTTDDDATDDDTTDDDTTDDDTTDDDDATDDDTTDDDATDDDDTSNGADAGLSDAGGDDVPFDDAGVWDGGLPELDGGDLVPPDGGVQSDSGVAECTPLTQPAPQADGGACFPACIAELQAACSPAGACGSNSGEAFEITSCWSNGVELTTSVTLGATSMSDNVMFNGDDLCYASSYSFDEGSYEWTNSCGEVVAIGVEDQINPSLVTITCLETEEDTLVDLENPACDSFGDGVPSVVECSEDPSCGQ